MKHCTVKKERIATASIDTATTMPSRSEQPGAIQGSGQLSEVQTLWNEANEALKNNDWETFGKKMKAIEELLNQ